MSRSGYDYNDSNGLWRGMVASAIRGKRGQSFLVALLAALDAMPKKRLIQGTLETSDGSVCALGALGKARGIDMSEVDPEDSDLVAMKFNIAEPLAREVAFLNDEEIGAWLGWESPKERWVRMRKWVANQIKADRK